MVLIIIYETWWCRPNSQVALVKCPPSSNALHPITLFRSLERTWPLSSWSHGLACTAFHPFTLFPFPVAYKNGRSHLSETMQLRRYFWLLLWMVIRVMDTEANYYKLPEWPFHLCFGFPVRLTHLSSTKSLHIPYPCWGGFHCVFPYFKEQKSKHLNASVKSWFSPIWM